MNLAIIGATGNVGRKTIEVLEKSKIQIDELFLVASKKSASSKSSLKKELEVLDLENYDFSKSRDYFFAAGSLIAKQWVPKASKKTIVIDNSRYFRMEKEIPLVVAEVNPEQLKKHRNVIANPNCSTIQMVLALKPLHENIKLRELSFQLIKLFQAQVKQQWMNY